MEKSQIYTVTEITKAIKFLLQDQFPGVWVQGEISNFTRAQSGHFYFSLVDEYTQLQCVMFQSENENLLFTPEDGMKVKGFGRIDVYEKRGNYQFYVETLTPLGVGELAIAFEQLKRRLAAEGLFDSIHKKPLPEYPERVGIVTSPTGAVIQDLLNILRRRQPSLEITLKPVRVQGDGASFEIADAIDAFNRYGKVELLIVGRGGGSMEDLWAFNEEVVARAIYRSRIPVISAVGHEIDYTIADFVADLRAPTPSAAAELAVRDRQELLTEIRHLLIRAGKSLNETVASSREKVQGLLRSYGFRRPLDIVNQHRQTLDEYVRRLDLSWEFRFQSFQEGIYSIQKRLDGVNPEAVLSRGYSITYRLPERQVVRKSAVLHPEDKIEVQFQSGRAFCIVEEKEP
ncbi:exodeoxyribonuclease VII large subunit [candidate division TA06 bacterium]|nr:exodeoxyribonuclease VII large subunit [candidate division TA06 bacterium]